MYIYIYIYILRERETYVYIYIYIYTHIYLYLSLAKPGENEKGGNTKARKLVSLVPPRIRLVCSFPPFIILPLVVFPIAEDLVVDEDVVQVAADLGEGHGHEGLYNVMCVIHMCTCIYIYIYIYTYMYKSLFVYCLLRLSLVFSSIGHHLVQSVVNTYPSQITYPALRSKHIPCPALATASTPAPRSAIPRRSDSKVSHGTRLARSSLNRYRCG